MEPAIERIISRVKQITDTTFVTLTHRCNRAIFLALTIAKKQGKNMVLIPDMGGWLTFRQYPKKLGMGIVELKTDAGLLDPSTIEKHASHDSVLLVHSLAAYAVLLDMNEIAQVCARKGSLLINDCSGSIGTPEARVGDLVVCSFGEEKPVNAGYGGFIATNDRRLAEQIPKEEFDKNRSQEVLNHLTWLDTRRAYLQEVNARIKKDLSHLDIVHRDKEGINVLVRTTTGDALHEVIEYCTFNNLPWTQCPRYIRILEPAISIEVKRLE